MNIDSALLVLKAAIKILNDPVIMDAIFDSEQMTEEEKTHIRDLREKVTDRWNDMAPR